MDKDFIFEQVKAITDATTASYKTGYDAGFLDGQLKGIKETKKIFTEDTPDKPDCGQDGDYLD